MAIKATGRSGKEYLFDKFEISSSINVSNCIYIYAKEVPNSFEPIYIGMTTRTFAERYAEHDYDGINECVGFHEANCILIHSHGNTILCGYTENDLKNIEEDLLNKYNTPCNTQNN